MKIAKRTFLKTVLAAAPASLVASQVSPGSDTPEEADSDLPDVVGVFDNLSPNLFRTFSKARGAAAVTKTYLPHGCVAIPRLVTEAEWTDSDVRAALLERQRLDGRIFLGGCLRVKSKHGLILWFAETKHAGQGKR
jgi:hypothetical protein